MELITEAYDWVLLAPGPSLQSAISHSVLPKHIPIVAVNTAAVVHERGLPINFLCAQDGPGALVNIQLAPLIASGVVVWCRDSQSYDWRAKGFRVWSHPKIEKEFRDALVQDPAVVPYTSLTIITALARIIALGGKSIYVAGCDMAGAGYAFGVHDKKKRTNPVWERRWNSERTVFNAARKQWEKNGIRITLAQLPAIT